MFPNDEFPILSPNFTILFHPRAKTKKTFHELSITRLAASLRHYWEGCGSIIVMVTQRNVTADVATQMEEANFSARSLEGPREACVRARACV